MDEDPFSGLFDELLARAQERVREQIDTEMLVAIEESTTAQRAKGEGT